MSFKNNKKQDDTLLNEDIRFKEVRCNADDGSSHGIMTSRDALALADEAGLDLVCIAPNAKPPVVKIMNYGKFKYQQEKKIKEAKKNQKIIVTKEIKLSVKIAQNDIDYKVKHAREFLEKGNHVKFRVFLRGREMANPAAGAEVLTRVWPMVEDIASKENDPKLEGRYVNMLVVPLKKEKH
ncbi:translation initiation factor IF-3 [Arcobacter sp. 15-2]|uniref:translation initiation factor IF-3 n=1 Tax=Arcobacter sp. 15-2 TaxID=3374109 RepID=UPI00399CDE00